MPLDVALSTSLSPEAHRLNATSKALHLRAYSLLLGASFSWPDCARDSRAPRLSLSFENQLMSNVMVVILGRGTS